MATCRKDDLALLAGSEPPEPGSSSSIREVAKHVSTAVGRGCHEMLRRGQLLPCHSAAWLCTRARHLLGIKEAA